MPHFTTQEFNTQDSFNASARISLKAFELGIINSLDYKDKDVVKSEEERISDFTTFLFKYFSRFSLYTDKFCFDYALTFTLVALDKGTLVGYHDLESTAEKFYNFFNTIYSTFAELNEQE